jgi:site-specific recombinase XerC
MPMSVKQRTQGVNPELGEEKLCRATYLLESGTVLRYIQELLGHKVQKPQKFIHV